MCRPTNCERKRFHNLKMHSILVIPGIYYIILLFTTKTLFVDTYLSLRDTLKKNLLASEVLVHLICTDFLLLILS